MKGGANMGFEEVPAFAAQGIISVNQWSILHLMSPMAWGKIGEHLGHQRPFRQKENGGYSCFSE